ncbi:MAG: V-type ATP synthase subunit D [Verrucomicrobiota bacterium]|nr:V-type ATP synthase subunit D [Verrucomicrobiota bacterium]
MSLKLSKAELRNQQTRLQQFQRYLPTLQLKKAMLQFEVLAAVSEVTHLRSLFEEMRQQVEAFAPFFAEKVKIDLERLAEIRLVEKHYENIAGVEIPVLDRVLFTEESYSFFATPVWSDRALELVRELALFREKLSVAEEKKRALEKELRDVSIRVNLFEKRLIPKAEEHIGRIRIFLGDQQLAAVAQAKVAKAKLQRE